MITSLVKWALDEYCPENQLKKSQQGLQWLHSLKGLTSFQGHVHVGGRFDVNTVEILAKYPEITEATKIHAYCKASEISARLGVGLILEDAAFREQVSYLTFVTVLEGLLQNTANLDEKLHFILAKMPKVGSLSDIDSPGQRWILHSWSTYVLSNWTPNIVPVRWQVSPLDIIKMDLGTVWFSDSIQKVDALGDLYALPAIQSIEEILQRHVRAASKRLRGDQIHNIRIVLPQFFENQDVSALKQWIARLIIAHEWTDEMLNPQWLQQHTQSLRHLENRVHIEYSAQANQVLLQNLLEQFSGVLAGTSPMLLKGLFQLPSYDWSTPKQVLQSHKVRQKLSDLVYATRDLNRISWNNLQIPIPTEVELFTTRGGKWPERRNHRVPIS